MWIDSCLSDAVRKTSCSKRAFVMEATPVAVDDAAGQEALERTRGSWEKRLAVSDCSGKACSRAGTRRAPNLSACICKEGSRLETSILCVVDVVDMHHRAELFRAEPGGTTCEPKGGRSARALQGAGEARAHFPPARKPRCRAFFSHHHHQPHGGPHCGRSSPTAANNFDSLTT